MVVFRSTGNYLTLKLNYTRLSIYANYNSEMTRFIVSFKGSYKRKQQLYNLLKML